MDLNNLIQANLKGPGKVFPILYKKTKTGAVQCWLISVQHAPGESTILTSYGQVGGAIQRTEELITSGKNIGKANETTVEQQAELEAKARWTKQLKKGYVQDLEKAQKGEDDIGGVVPMLAHNFDDHGHKLTYPVDAQPKYDGIRAIALIRDGKCSLWSRTRKPITSCPHIVEEFEKLCAGMKGEIAYDGELYLHKLNNDFENIVSAVRTEAATDASREMQYHIYDVVMDVPYSERFQHIVKTIPADNHVLRITKCLPVRNPEEVRLAHDQFVAEGYEGAIVRSAEGGYEHGRSYSLQKVKIFRDEEFPIVAVEEGRGKMAGKAIFVCQTPEELTFTVKMEGSLSKLEEIWKNRDAYIGKRLTVKFQNKYRSGVPRFPIGLRIREEE